MGFCPADQYNCSCEREQQYMDGFTDCKYKKQTYSIWKYFNFTPRNTKCRKVCISQVKSEPLRNSILNHPKIKSYSLVDSFFNHSSVSRIRKDGPFIFKTCDLCVNR